MVYAPIKQAIFAGLVVDEQGQALETAYVGNTPCYVIVEDDFRRHVEAEKIDRQVLSFFHAQVLANRELVTQSLLNLLGKDDLFTKAMIDASIENAEANMARLAEEGLPENARAWLGLLGFRVVVDVHGDVVRIDSPEMIAPE